METASKRLKRQIVFFFSTEVFWLMTVVAELCIVVLVPLFFLISIPR
jgi:hypothetical protein